MYVFLDAFFLIFHSSLVLFNGLGWMGRATRRANLATLLATLGSWVVLGLWKGFGYCPCTDWHWQVRRRLGDEALLGDGGVLPRSYMKFLADTLLGADLPAAAVDTVTVAGLALALAASAFLNARDAGWLNVEG